MVGIKINNRPVAAINTISGRTRDLHPYAGRFFMVRNENKHNGIDCIIKIQIFLIGK